MPAGYGKGKVKVMCVCVCAAVTHVETWCEKERP